MQSTFAASWFEDGSALVMGRLCGHDATGSASPEAGEGLLYLKIDVASITCAVYDLTGTTPGTPVVSPTVTVASAVYDTLQTADNLWSMDSHGYNFRHELPTTAFPTADHTYLVRYTVVSTGGAVSFGQFKGQAKRTTP